MLFNIRLVALFKSVLIVLSMLILTACASSPKDTLVSSTPIVKPNNKSGATLKNNQPKIALVLGSGGARGYAHIGVIQVLEEYGIKPDFIVGTSAGSIVGSLYASGKTAQDLEKIALALKPSDVRDLTLSLQGFFDGKKIENYINRVIGGTKLEDLNIPMYIVATELKSGKSTVFQQGDTGQAVRASTTIPSMFVPTKIDGAEYVDGGLVSPLPVEIAKNLGADMIIAVDILAKPQHTDTSNIWGLFNQNINVMQNRLAQNEAKFADVLIQPDLREKQHVFSTKSRMQTILAGKQATLSQIQRIQNIVEQKKTAYTFHDLEK